MRGPRPLLLVALLLLALLGWLQYRLWFGVGGQREVDALAEQVAKELDVTVTPQTASVCR